MGKCFTKGENKVNTVNNSFAIVKIPVNYELETIKETSREFSYSFEKVFSDLESKYGIICSELSTLTPPPSPPKNKHNF